MLKSLFRNFIKTSVINKGLRGNSSAWMVVGAFGLLKRFYDRGGHRSEQVVLTERIRPGDELVLKYPGKPARGVRKEIDELSKRRNAAVAERAETIARLQRKVNKGGFGSKKAARELASMTSNGSKLSKALAGAVSGAANGLRGSR